MINLTNQEQFTVGGVVQESNSIAGVTLVDVDYLNQTFTFAVRTGSLVNNNIQPSARGQQIQVQINLASGAVAINGTQMSTLGAPSLAVINNAIKNIRNLLEAAVVNQSILAGVQTIW